MMDNAAASKNNNSFTRKVWITAGISLLVITFFLLFKTLFSLILLTLAGVLMAVYFYGFAGLLKRYLHMPSKWSIIISVIFNIVLLIGFLFFAGLRLQQQIAELSDTLPKTFQQVKDHLNNSALGSKLLNYFNASGNSKRTVAAAKKFFSSSFGILSDLYIVLLIGLFFTASPSVYKKGIVSLLPPKAKDKGSELINEISTVLKNWLKGQILGFFLIAILTAIGLWIIGMPLILTLALIAGFLNFIPNFGPIIALIPAVLLAILQGPTTAIIVICIYTAVQIIQNTITPIIQNKMINLPPALIIIGQVAMGMLAGFWGILLATPVVAILITIVNKLYVKPQSH